MAKNGQEGISIQLTEHPDGTGRVYFLKDNGTASLLARWNLGDSTNLAVNSKEVMDALRTIRDKTFRLIGGVKCKTRSASWGACFGNGNSSTMYHGPFLGCKIQLRDTQGRFQKVIVIGELPR